MPLTSSTIVTEVRKIVDPTADGHAFPASADATKSAWAAAVGVYFAGLAAPTLVPGTLALAQAAMVAAFNPALGVAGLEAGLAAFAAAVVAGLAPGQVATPPPSPPSWGTLTNTADGAARGAQLGAALDAWARTGLVGATPGPPALPWS